MGKPDDRQRKIDTFIQYLEDRIRVGERDAADFAKKFAKEPLEALRWSEQAFTFAARTKLARYALKLFIEAGDKISVPGLRATALENALRGALYPCHNTSQTHNLAAQAECQAWAELYQSLVDWDF